MKSPVTGKEMTLKKENRKMTFRKETFEIVYHYYLCEDSGAQFEDDYLAGLNITQVHNKYRERFNLPFQDEIKAVRKKYKISARKMSEILGFGTNTYGNYEKGEIPSKANARLIQLIKNPEEFMKLAEYSGNLTNTLKKRISDIIAENKSLNYQIENRIFTEKFQTSLNGYRMFDKEKAFQMIVFFAETLKPWKTKLNKLLFYADFYNYKKHAFSISGLKYAPINYGPVPDDYELLFNIGRKEGVIKSVIKEVDKDVTGELILPMKNIRFNDTLFSKSELETLNAVAERFTGIPTSEIVRMSHKEKAWTENYKKRAIIDYNYGFDLKYM